jgi:hypothetical protein
MLLVVACGANKSVILSTFFAISDSCLSLLRFRNQRLIRVLRPHSFVMSPSVSSEIFLLTSHYQMQNSETETYLKIDLPFFFKSRKHRAGDVYRW